MESKTRVLVVDEEAGILRFIRASLTLAGYDVITTTSGEEALRLVEEKKPDIMLLDIIMMPMSGLDVLSKLRTFSQIPVIASSSQSLLVDKAVQQGANDFIAKPFKPDELKIKIKAVLAHHRHTEMNLATALSPVPQKRGVVQQRRLANYETTSRSPRHG